MDVVFAVVPFADVDRPAIGVSLLKAELVERGVSCAIEYLNFDLAERIGPTLYTSISESLPSETLVGEWFFADVLFRDQLPPEQQYLSRVLSQFASPALIDQICAARKCRTQFIDTSVEKLRSANARVVGFTTTFHQTCCCLAIAKRLKETPNPPIVAFGGANCEGEMGLQLLRSFPWIDYVCTREGDVAFPDLVCGLLGRGADVLPRGILKQGESAEVTTPALVTDLDSLPIPDYGDYFARFAQMPAEIKIKPELLIETSRGCWWGAKQHCTFCGLNGDTMRFRSKSPERAFDELAFLTKTYGVKKIDCVDNILDLRYINDLFPRLRDSGLELELFYEVKSNLRLEQIATLAAGGVRAVQPGIESFSNEVLRRMKKGCTGLQNIQLLRWCEEFGIAVAWNLLAGFPGEAPEEYSRIAELLPLLNHLPPPTSCSPIRLDRFSPLFAQQDQHGLRRVRPTSAYFYVYPMGGRELARMAYFFDFDYPDNRNPHSYLSDVKREVELWLVARASEPAARPRLDATSSNDGCVHVTDTRASAVRSRHRLCGLAGKILVACDRAQSLDQLVNRCDSSASRDAIKATLADLIDDKLIIEIEGLYLTLAIMRNREVLHAIRKWNADDRFVETKATEPLLHLV